MTTAPSRSTSGLVAYESFFPAVASSSHSPPPPAGAPPPFEPAPGGCNIMAHPLVNTNAASVSAHLPNRVFLPYPLSLCRQLQIYDKSKLGAPRPSVVVPRNVRLIGPKSALFPKLHKKCFFSPSLCAVVHGALRCGQWLLAGMLSLLTGRKSWQVVGLKSGGLKRGMERRGIETNASIPHKTLSERCQSPCR